MERISHRGVGRFLLIGLVLSLAGCSADMQGGEHGDPNVEGLPDYHENDEFFDYQDESHIVLATAAEAAHGCSEGCPPYGYLDEARADFVRGWACDADRPEEELPIHIYVNGEFVQAGMADQAHEAAVTAACYGGEQHRYHIPLERTLACGDRVDVYALNAADTPGHSIHLGSYTRQCKPIGELDVVDREGRVSGWVCDQDANGAATDAHIYLVRNGERRMLLAMRANYPSEPQVAALCGGGDAHRFEAEFHLDCGDTIEVYGINYGAGIENPLIGSKRIVCYEPWATPVHGRLSSGFGTRIHPITGDRRFHGGVDVAAGHGTPIRATKSGTVAIRRFSSTAGNFVHLNHEDGTGSRYMHLSAFAVSGGQRVSQGQVIGYVGSTGRSTGPHLHFETFRSGMSGKFNPVETEAY